MEYWLLESAKWKLHNKVHANVLSKPFSPADVYDAIDKNCRGNFRGHNRTNWGDILLGTVDAIYKRIPHTNDATKRA
jgi:hypothetical protein